jgi:hypothetical protein
MVPHDLEITHMASYRDEQTLLRSLLAQLRRRLRVEMALEFALEAAALLAAAAALLVLFDWWFRLGQTARVVLLVVALTCVVPFSLVRALKRWRACRLDDLALALVLDRFRPGTGGRIADVLQLPDLLAQPSSEVSPAMIRLAVKRASEALAASDWASLWNTRRTITRGAALFLTLLVPALFGILAPHAARLSVARWLLGSDERWPQRSYLAVTGLGKSDRLIAPRDEPFALEVRADLPALEPRGGKWILPGRGEELLLRSLPRVPEVPSAVRVRERTPRGRFRDALMTITGPASFRHELPPSPTSSTFELFGGDDWLGPIKVERVDRPALASARLRVREPGTAGDTFRVVEEGVQQPVFLPDTDVELTLSGNEPLSDARLTVHPGAPPKLARAGERQYVARWVLREPTTLEVELTSRATGLTSKPAYLSVGILKDREPRVTLRALGVGAHVTPVATIPLSIAATDDMGLSAVSLQAERVTIGDDKSEPKTSKKTVPLPLAAGAGRAVLDHQARHDVELQVDQPAVGTLLRFVAEATDRCARGAQVGRSTVLHMQVVPPNVLYYEILLRQRTERARFVALLDTAEKQTPMLAGSPRLDTYGAVVRGLHASSRQLDLIAGRIAETLQEMKLNQVGSPKAHRLLQEGVIDPIRALNTGPITELRGMLQSLSGSGPKTDVDPESARSLHARLVAAMKTILDQMSQWESFVDVVNQVAEVIKMQHNVLDATEKARESRTQGVFDAKP